MDDLRIRAVGDLRGPEQRRGLAVREAGQERREPGAVAFVRKDAAHQVGLHQRGREEIRAGGLPCGRRATVALVPRERPLDARALQRAIVGRACVVDREREPERGVRVHPVADRIARARQEVQVARGERPRERRERARPPARVRVVVGAQLARELEEPRPAVGPLERLRAGPREVGALGRDRLGGEVLVERRVDRRALRQRRDEPAQPGERPVHVDARVPVEAAVEHRVELARRTQVFGRAEHVVGLVRKLGPDVPEREPREPRGGRKRERVDGHRRRSGGEPPIVAHPDHGRARRPGTDPREPTRRPPLGSRACARAP